MLKEAGWFDLQQHIVTIAAWTNMKSMCVQIGNIKHHGIDLITWIVRMMHWCVWITRSRISLQDWKIILKLHSHDITRRYPDSGANEGTFIVPELHGEIRFKFRII